VRIDEALTGVIALGVETAPFIYFVERHAAYIERMRAVFERADRGDLQIITSVITLLEVLAVPTVEGRQDVQNAYRHMLMNTPQVAAVPVNAAIAEQAALIRATYRLRTPDALHIATAIVAGCDAFLTNDMAFKRVKDIPVLLLDELELD
jgi:predicted nucleic acid-binding protein